MVDDGVAPVEVSGPGARGWSWAAIGVSALVLQSLNVVWALGAWWLARGAHGDSPSAMVVVSAVSAAVGGALSAVIVGARGSRFRRRVGVSTRLLASEWGLMVRILWPALVGSALLILVSAAMMRGEALVVAGIAGLIGPGVALLRTGLVVHVLMARRTLARLETLRPAGARCTECGLEVSAQRGARPAGGFAVFIVPFAALLVAAAGVAVGFVLLTVRSNDPSSGMLRFSPTGSWQAVALVVFPLYVLLVLSWVLPRWIAGRPARCRVQRRLALGRCACCGHPLASPRELGLAGA